MPTPTRGASGKTPINTRRPVQRKSGSSQEKPSSNSNPAQRASGQNTQSQQQQKPARPLPRQSQNNQMRAEFARDEIMLDDCSMITDMLVTQKNLVKRYGNALCEGSSQKFRSIVNSHLTEIADDQFDSFIYMQQNDLYPTEPAPMPKITEAKQKFKETEQKLKR